jgi:hypothetical protein
MYKNVIKSLVNTSERWVIACSIVGTHSSRRNPNPLSWNKAIRNIPFDVNLMGLIILKLGPECLVVFTESFFVRGRMKNSQDTKMRYHVIKSGISRKISSKLSNSVLTLVRLENDSMEG